MADILAKQSETGGWKCAEDEMNAVNGHSKLHHGIREFCLSKDHEDERSFYVMDFEEIERSCQTMERELPHVTPFYAVKCNTDPVLLKFLANKRSSFDCASKAEMKMILNMSVSADRIVISNAHKTIEDLKFASEMGVDMMISDSQEELHKIKRYAPQAKILIRIKEPSSIPGEPGTECNPVEKFGCRPEDAVELIETCIRLNLQLIGVSYHIESISHEPLLCHSAIAQSKQVFRLAEDRGVKMTLLDIGGGLPGADDKTMLSKIFQIIRECLTQHFPPSTGVRVISEPGTYYAKSAFTLVARVIAKKITKGVPTRQVISNLNDLYKHEVHNFDDSGETLDVMAYVLSVGTFTGLGSRAMHVEDHRAMLIKKSNEERRLPSVIWGPSCDPRDRLLKGVLLLPELIVGDWVYFTNVGNYTSVVASNFNGTGLPYTVYISDGRIIEAQSLNM